LIYTGLSANDGTSDYHIPHVWVKGWLVWYCKYCNQKISKEKESSQCVDNKEPETLSGRLCNYQRCSELMEIEERLVTLAGLTKEYDFAKSSGSLDLMELNHLAGILIKERTRLQGAAKIMHYRMEKKERNMTQIAGLGLQGAAGAAVVLETMDVTNIIPDDIGDPTTLAVSTLLVVISGLATYAAGSTKSDKENLEKMAKEFMEYDFNCTGTYA
jgi:hypothetical protein